MPKKKVLVYLDNERDILEKLINYSPNDWRSLPEFDVLKTHFKVGGGIKDVEYFYKNIEKLCSYRNSQGCDLIYTYCRNVIKGRLPEQVEKRVFPIFWKNWRSGKVGYKYAKYVARGKLEGLESGCKSLDYVFWLEEKKLELTNVLMDNAELSYYFYRNVGYLPEIVHNFMIAMNMAGSRYAKIYFKYRKKDDKLLKKRLGVIDGSKTIREFLDTL